MNTQKFQSDSWLHFRYTAPRFFKTHWLLMALLTAAYLFTEHFTPQVENTIGWYSLTTAEHYIWYASTIMSVIFPLTLTFAVLRFICLDDGVSLTLTPKIVARFFLAFSLVYVAIGLGTALLVVPGFLLWTSTLLVPVLVLAHGYTLVEAFYASATAVKGYIWKITLGFLPVMGAIVLVYLGLYFLFNALGWQMAVYLLDAFLFQLYVLVSASYTMTLYSHAEYNAAKEPRGLKIA